MSQKLTASIVLYNSDKKIINRAVESLLGSSLISKIYIIDNSPVGMFRSFFHDPKIEYLFMNTNLGFGKAHNIGIEKAVALQSKYHIVMNPDVYFESGTLEKIYEFIDKDDNIGLVSPKILYPDGAIQYLCKLLPEPLFLFLRRFLPFKKYIESKNNKYELRFSEYNKVMDIPNLSGCFMFLRMETLKKIGFFDERFFMYFEDVDLCRRINQYKKTVFFPDAIIYHDYQKGSYKNLTLLKYHLNSAVKYFNKWGFVDKNRKKINSKTLHVLGYKK